MRFKLRGKSITARFRISFFFGSISTVNWMIKCGLPSLLYGKKTLITINLIFENTKEPQDLSCPTQTHSSIQEHWVDISGRGNIPPIRTSKNIWRKNSRLPNNIFYLWRIQLSVVEQIKGFCKKLSKFKKLLHEDKIKLNLTNSCPQ